MQLMWNAAWQQRIEIQRLGTRLNKLCSQRNTNNVFFLFKKAGSMHLNF